MGHSFERFVGIDWSGAARTSGQQIYVAEAHRHGGRITLHSVLRARDRAAVETFLRGGALEPAPAWAGWPGPTELSGRRARLIGLDFAFGFPAAFRHPDRPDGRWDWPDLGRLASSLDSDGAGVRERLAGDPLLDEGGEHVGHALVERTGLAPVGQTCAELGDAVGELVGEDVDGSGERPEHYTVAVSEHEPRTVPEGVHVRGAVVHGDAHRRPGAVHRRPPEDLLEHVQRRSGPAVGVVDTFVTARRIPVEAHRPAGQVLGVVRAVDDEPSRPGNSGAHRGALEAALTQHVVDEQRRSAARRDLSGSGRSEVTQQVRGDEVTAIRATHATV